MKTLKPWLVIILVFIAGFVGGVVTTRAVVRHWVGQAIANPDRVRGLIQRRLALRLRLDRQQRQEVNEILTDTQAELRHLRMDFAPRYSEIMSNAQSEISAILTPEQRVRFDRLREENRFLFAPPPPRRPPPPQAPE